MAIRSGSRYAGNCIDDNFTGPEYADIETVADNIEEVIIVAENIEDINILGDNIDTIIILGENPEAVKKLADNVDSVIELAANIKEVVIVADNIEDVIFITSEIKAGVLEDIKNVREETEDFRDEANIDATFLRNASAKTIQNSTVSEPLASYKDGVFSFEFPNVNYPVQIPYVHIAKEGDKVLSPTAEFKAAYISVNGAVLTLKNDFSIIDNSIYLTEALKLNDEVYCILGASILPNTILLDDINATVIDVLAKDLVGRQLFYGQTGIINFLSSNTYKVTEGYGYLNNIRFMLNATDILVPRLPNKVWIDVFIKNNQFHTNIIVSDIDKTDYLDIDQIMHYVDPLASISAENVITDLRGGLDVGLGEDLYKRFLRESSETKLGISRKATQNEINTNVDGNIYVSPNYLNVKLIAHHAWSNLTGKPLTFPSSPHNHDWNSILNKPSTFPSSSHTHPWAQVTGRPATFPATAHDHARLLSGTNAITVDNNHVWVNKQQEASGLKNITLSRSAAPATAAAGSIWIQYT